MFREPEVERDKDAVEEEVEELEKELDLNLADTHLALSRFLLSMYFTRTLLCVGNYVYLSEYRNA